MISVTRLRSGVVFKDQTNLYQVLEYKHTHLSRGSGTIRVKVRNLRTGSVAFKVYRSGDEVRETEIERRELQYLYGDETTCFLMDPKTFEQVEILKQVLGERVKFLQEGSRVYVLLADNQALDVDLPVKMDFKVAETAPGVKGNTTSNAYKAAVLENGLKVKVPLFIEAGEKVRVDTRTGEYVGRVKG